MKNLILFLFLFFLIPFSSFSQKKGQAYVDSLLTELPKAKEDTNKVKLLNDLCYAYWNLNADESIKYAEEALALAEKIKWEKGIINSISHLGSSYWTKSDYTKALEYHTKALKLNEKSKDKKNIARSFNNLGNIYNEKGDYPKALEYYFQALKLNEELGIKEQIAANNSNIGLVYQKKYEFPKALEYYDKVLKLNEELENKEGMATTLGNMGNTYLFMGDYPKALEYCNRALKINQELEDKEGIAMNYADIGIIYEDSKDFPNALRYLENSVKVAQELGKKYQVARGLGEIGMTYLAIAKDSTKQELNKRFGGNKGLALQEAKTYTEKAIQQYKEIKSWGQLMGMYSNLSEIHSLLGSDKEALANYKDYTAAKDSVFNDRNRKKLLELESARTQELHQKELEIKDLQIRKSKNERGYFVGGILLLISLSVLLYSRYRIKDKANILITKEKARSEELLLNILPSEVAEELKKTGSTTAKDFEEVTVLFTDFKNFTKMSESLSAQELVNEINYCYSAFDKIITHHGIEKIKTIGDAYMCAGGLPVANKTHAIDTVRAAIEIRDFMLAEQQKRQAVGKTYFEIRIGCHTGPVVAGIVGIKKFAYDIWGDTVNIASRMESSSEPSKVNISGRTYELVKDSFTCTYRGKIEAKSKGMIDMYFVEGEIKNT